MSHNAPTQRSRVQLPTGVHRLVTSAHRLSDEVQQIGAESAAHAMLALDAPVLAAVFAALADACAALGQVTSEMEKAVQLPTPTPSDDFADPIDRACSFADTVSDLAHAEGGFLVALEMLDPRRHRDDIILSGEGTFIVDLRNPLDHTVERHEVPDMARAIEVIDGPRPFDNAEVTVQFASHRDGKVLLTPVHLARAAGRHC